jgi:hypothetical protein
MESAIEQYIWTLLEDLGFDLENDNDTSELCDKCIDRIFNVIKRHNENQN